MRTRDSRLKKESGYDRVFSRPAEPDLTVSLSDGVSGYLTYGTGGTRILRGSQYLKPRLRGKERYLRLGTERGLGGEMRSKGILST